MGFYGPKNYGGGMIGGSPAPFTNDTNTYWWDFNGIGNTYDTTGDDTIAVVPELIGRQANLIQPIKDYQPFKVTTGANFGDTSVRHLSCENVDGITNGANGWYLAFNARFAGNNSYLLTIQRNASSANSRARVYLNGSSQLAIAGNTTDSTTINVIAASQALNLNQWYSIEIVWDTDADTFKIYINGVEATYSTSPTGGPWDSFPSTDPSSIIFGNGSSTATTSLNGIITEAILYNGAVSTEIQTSVGDYINAQRIDIPDAPVITAVGGNGIITVTFAAPDAHNSPITDYEYQYKLDTEPTTWTDFSDGTSTTPGTTITGVTNDLAYDVRVRAVNAEGNSAWSNIETPTPVEEPGVPDAPVLSLITGDQQAIYSYSAPNANGSTITNYKHYYRNVGSGTWLEYADGVSATPGATLTGLTNGVEIEAYVTAVNGYGESAASNTASGTPAALNQLTNVVASAVMDIDVTRTPCYSGSGTTLSNLVETPADGSAQTAYDLVLGDGSTSTTYPTFSGTAGSPSSKFVFDGGDYLKIKNGNTAFLNNMHKTTGGSAHWIIIFGTFVNKASEQHIYSTRSGGTAIGVNGYLNSSEAVRLSQTGDTATVAASPSQTVTLGARNFIAFSMGAGGGTLRTWTNTTTKTSTTRSYNACVTNPTQDLKLCIQNATGFVENLTEIYAIAMGNGFIDDADVAALVTEYQSRHGVDYTP